MTLLSVRNVRKEFRVRGATGRRTIRPVDDVSFDVEAGTTVALVGESGSGKSTLSRVVMGLHRPDAGEVLLDGRPWSSLRGGALRARRHEAQMVFQNPLRSFDPMQSIGASIREVLRLDETKHADPDRRVEELLVSVGLSPTFAGLRPGRVSGGELQRASIARAISAAPGLLVLDEPTSALDVSIQGQVLTLLDELQRANGIGYLMATHDLKVVRLTTHRVIVLNRGRIVEAAPTAELFADARHPYTRRLLAAEHGSVESDAAEPAAVRPAPAGDCPVIGGSCPSPHHQVEVSPGHTVVCWRADDPEQKEEAA